MNLFIILTFLNNFLKLTELLKNKKFKKKFKKI